MIWSAFLRTVAAIASLFDRGRSKHQYQHPYALVMREAFAKGDCIEDVVAAAKQSGEVSTLQTIVFLQDALGISHYEAREQVFACEAWKAEAECHEIIEQELINSMIEQGAEVRNEDGKKIFRLTINVNEDSDDSPDRIEDSDLENSQVNPRC